MNSKVTYRQQFTRCGKQRCRKCKEGAGHGPYWYAFWSANGRTVSKYIGIHLPENVKIETQKSKPVQLDKVVSEATSRLDPRSARDQAQKDIFVETSLPVSRSHSSSLEDSAGKQSTLRIYVLGQFRIERMNSNEWQTISGRSWQRRRARALLGCLLSNPGRRLGREKAMEALWPDLDRETATNRLNGAVHELRQILEPEIARPAASQMLRLERDVLLLAGASQIWVDADRFEGLINKANVTSAPMQAEQLLEEAAQLCDLITARQKALQTLEEAHGSEMTRIEGRSQRLLGRILAAQGRREQADRYFEQAIDVFNKYEMRLDYARALHGYGFTLLQRGVPGDVTYQRGFVYLRQARDLFRDCGAAIDLDLVERILTNVEYQNTGIL